MICNFCGSVGETVFEAKGIPVLDCTRCGHRYAGMAVGPAHPDQFYSDEYFTGGGAGYSDYSAESEMLTKRGRMYANILSPYCTPGKMLDVGAAAGYLLRGFVDAGWSGIGIEPNHSMALLAQTSMGVDVRQGSLEDLETDERFDLVSMIQVAAHFYDAKAAFRKAYDLLKPGGMLLIETWDRGSQSARLLGRHWHEYSPPTVLHWFSRDWLDGHLTDRGFERVAAGRPKKKISGGHVRSLLKYRLGDISLLRLIPERIEFPYPSEDLFWALYRKHG